MKFPEIAATTEGLSVKSIACTSVENWNYMVQHEILSGPTVETLISGPFSALQWGEVLSVPSKFWKLAIDVVDAPWKTFNHFFSVLTPSFFECIGEFLSGFYGSFRTGQSFFRRWNSFLGLRHPGSNVFWMNFVPVWITRPRKKNGHAFLGACLGMVPFGSIDLTGASVKGLSANSAVKILTSKIWASVSKSWRRLSLFSFRHFALRFVTHTLTLLHVMPPSNNRVNSGDNSTSESTISYHNDRVNPEPSQKGNFLEGATVMGRAYGSNAMAVISRTSARPETDDMTWTIWRHIEAEFKRLCDNISDETLTVKPQDGITTAFYPWCEVGGTIAISRKEERQNSGEARILALLEKKIMQAEMSIKAKINQQILQGTVSSATFVPGNDTKDLFPLGYFLRYAPATDPTTGGNVGGISASTYSWWRPNLCNLATTVATGHKFGLAVTTFQGLKIALYRLYNYCSRGADGSGPNLIVCNQETYESYENALDVQKQYSDQGLAEMGFDSIKLKGATLVWDELVPDLYTGTVALSVGTAFYLNTKFYKLVIDKETDFVTTPFVEPENQTAKVAKVLFMGNTTTSNPRKLGAAGRISLSLTS